MPSGREVVYTPAAEDDLSEIYKYSIRGWGNDHAQEYIDHIYDVIESLAAFPESGEKRDHLGKGLRAKLVSDYYAYYRVTETEIIVRRVIHQKRDIRKVSGF